MSLVGRYSKQSLPRLDEEEPSRSKPLERVQGIGIPKFKSRVGLFVTFKVACLKGRVCDVLVIRYHYIENSTMERENNKMASSHYVICSESCDWQYTCANPV